MAASTPSTHNSALTARGRPRGVRVAGALVGAAVSGMVFLC
jgi:hypothetical protein